MDPQQKEDLRKEIKRKRDLTGAVAGGGGGLRQTTTGTGGGSGSGAGAGAGAGAGVVKKQGVQQQGKSPRRGDFRKRWNKAS